jgi:PAS domain S-box-containing protein
MNRSRAHARRQRLPSKWEIGGLIGSVVIADVTIRLTVHEPAHAILMMGAFTGASLGCAAGIYLRRRKDLETRVAPMAWVNDDQVIALLTLDAHGRILNANPAVEVLAGYRTEDLTGTHFACLYNERDFAAGKPRQLLEGARKRGTVDDRQQLLRRDGTHFSARLLLTCIHGGAPGSPAFVLALLPDATTVKDRRTGNRIPTEEPVQLRVLGGNPVQHKAQLLDFSQHGIRVALDHVVAAGANVIAEWRSGFLVGVVRNCRRGSDGWDIGIELEALPSSRAMVANLKTATEEKNSSSIGANV